MAEMMMVWFEKSGHPELLTGYINKEYPPQVGHLVDVHIPTTAADGSRTSELQRRRVDGITHDIHGRVIINIG